MKKKVAIGLSLCKFPQRRVGMCRTALGIQQDALCIFRPQRNKQCGLWIDMQWLERFLAGAVLSAHPLPNENDTTRPGVTTHTYCSGSEGFNEGM